MGERNRTPFDWVDTPWMVAALLGVWGVFMGVEEFFLANVFMVLAGASCTARLYNDSIRSRPRRKTIFVLGLLIILAIVGVDIHLTAKKRASVEAKDQEIPRLRSQVGTLQGTVTTLHGNITALGTDRKADEQISGQKLEDIKQQNKDLRKSVETKDAALVSIAKDQYALNFFPQIVVTTIGSTDTMYVENNGKTNVEIYRLVMDGQEVDDSAPETIAPSALLTYSTNEAGKAAILSAAQRTSSGKVSVSGTIFLSTLDKQKYHMNFVWYYQFKDGKISNSYISDGSIVAEK